MFYAAYMFDQASVYSLPPLGCAGCSNQPVFARTVHVWIFDFDCVGLDAYMRTGTRQEELQGAMRRCLDLLKGGLNLVRLALFAAASR